MTDEQPRRYEAALRRRGEQPAAALELLRFLTGAAAAQRFRRCGFTASR